MTVTFYSADPKVSPIQIEITDIPRWDRLVCLYIAPSIVSSVKDDISAFNFIEISHAKLPYLLRHYYDYKDKYWEKVNGRNCATDMYLEYNRLVMTWEMDWEIIYVPMLINNNVSTEDICKGREKYIEDCKKELIRRGFCEESDDPFGLLPYKHLAKVSWELNK